MYALCMKNRTTIQIRRDIRKELEKCKKYDRETYNDLLKRLIARDRKEVKK